MDPKNDDVIHVMFALLWFGIAAFGVTSLAQVQTCDLPAIVWVTPEDE